MTDRKLLETTDAGYIDVYTPDGEGESFETRIPNEDIKGIIVRERWAQRKDSGRVRLRNDGDAYTNTIGSGARLEIRVNYDLPPIGSWGDGTWGGGDQYWPGNRMEWTCWVRDRSITPDGPGMSTLLLECEDFVFGILSKRNVYDSFSEASVVGTLHDVVGEAAPNEARVTGGLEYEAETTSTYDGTDGYDAVNSLLERGGLLARGYGEQVVLIDPDELEPEFTIEPGDVSLLELQEDDAGMVNNVRVEGGTGRSIDAQWTGPRGGWRTIEAEETHSFSIPARKNEIDRIDLWTPPTDRGTYTVRIQEEDEDGEIHPDDTAYDIASIEQSHEFIAHDDWTAFDLPGHELASTRPWVIVEAGEYDIRIGTDERQDLPMYRSYVPFLILATDADGESIDTHRRRDGELSAEKIGEYNEAIELAGEKLSRSGSPEHEIVTSAVSHRTHMLRVGEMVEFSEAFDTGVVDSDTSYIVTDRDVTYDGHWVETDLTFAEL